MNMNWKTCEAESETKFISLQKTNTTVWEGSDKDREAKHTILCFYASVRTTGVTLQALFSKQYP